MRFYETDPEEQFASPYAYCGNDPINLIDPDGYEAKLDWDEKTVSDVKEAEKVAKKDYPFISVDYKNKKLVADPKYKPKNVQEARLIEIINSPTPCVLSFNPGGVYFTHSNSPVPEGGKQKFDVNLIYGENWGGLVNGVGTNYVGWENLKTLSKATEAYDKNTSSSTSEILFHALDEAYEQSCNPTWVYEQCHKAADSYWNGDVNVYWNTSKGPFTPRSDNSSIMELKKELLGKRFMNAGFNLQNPANSVEYNFIFRYGITK